MKCITVDCPNDKTPRTNFCKNCNASINMWARRKPAQLLQRISDLRRYADRMKRVRK